MEKLTKIAEDKKKVVNKNNDELEEKQPSRLETNIEENAKKDPKAVASDAIESLIVFILRWVQLRGYHQAETHEEAQGKIRKVKEGKCSILNY